MDQHGTIYEFHGCFYHGCSSCYPQRSLVNPVNDITMEELHTKTMVKTEMLRARGHTVIELWECEFKQLMKENPGLEKYYKHYEPYMPIDQRDAFFGGRTNAVQLYCEHPNICYVDFTR